ncbi:MFS transporter [Rubrivivax sp. A210]|uniref:MFS transporter n=1 Tax=Rubrivivax sp. A210 TaxID=2772301 RepID=UPI001917FBBC|nr:MFS transporter [Rubrivivax sp. A210]
MPVLFIGVFMAALDTAVIAPAIPVLRQSFDLDNRAAGLLTIVFVLASLASTALLANLGDRHGRRPVFLGSVALFALGSLVVAASPSYSLLLVGRAIQGMGGGGIIPTASAVIGDALPPHQRGRALGLIGAVYGMAFVLGPPLAALAIVVASWHWIFLANLPIAALVMVMGRRALPVQRRAGPLPPLDWPGVLLLFLLLCALVLGINQVTAASTWLLAAVPPLLLALVAAERRAAQPMVPLALFGRRQLALTYLLTAGAGFGMGGVIFLAALAHHAHGVDRSHGGFVLLPLVLCSMFGSMAAGRLINRLGPRSIILAGFAMLALGYGGVAILQLGLWGWLVATLPLGLGIGIVVGGALRGIAIDEAPPAQRGAAQGLVNICTSIGTLLAAAAIGALADFAGGQAAGLGLAYAMVALVMLAMLITTLALRKPAALADEAARAAS